MSWFKWLDTVERGRRFNDVTHAGKRWWAVATSADVWSWQDDSEEGPKPCAFSQGRLRAISMAPGGLVGWIGRQPGGPFGLMSKTENGGESWTPVHDLPEETPHSICALEALSEDAVWAAGAFFEDGKAARLLRLNEQGWQNVALPEPAPTALTDIWFFDAQPGSPRRGVVAGGRGRTSAEVRPAIFFTSDGGETWQEAMLPLGVPAGRYCWKLHFIDDNVGFASLEAAIGNGDPALLKTVNGGKAWELMLIVEPNMISGPVVSNLQCVAFAPWDSSLGWVGPRSRGLLTTWNGGANWHEVVAPAQVNRILVVGDTVVAAGDALYRYVRDSR